MPTHHLAQWPPSFQGVDKKDLVGSERFTATLMLLIGNHSAARTVLVDLSVRGDGQCFVSLNINEDLSGAGPTPAAAIESLLKGFAQ